MNKQTNTPSKDNINKIFQLLRIKKLPDNLDLLSDLPIIALKGVDVQTNHVLNTTLGISTIRQLAEVEITPQDQKELRKNGIPASSIEKLIAAAKIILNIKQLSSKPRKKIIFMGLDNAGKSSIINLLTNNFGIDTFIKMKPTKNIERHEIIGVDSNYTIWDFGGQNTYRTSYLDDPERFLLNINILFYVIDIQDIDRHQESFHYFKKIIDILNFLNEKPEIIILIHKFDPPIQSDPKYLEYVSKIQELFKDVISNFKYQFYTTSIYNYMPPNTEFISSIKNIFQHGFRKTDPQDYGNYINMVEHLMDSFIKFNVNVINTFRKISNRISKLESAVFKKSDATKPCDSPDSIITQKLSSIFDDIPDSINEDIKELFEKKIPHIL
ncbi:MAG: ADP-ribosylation factor-like protein [Candidatus Helarchaeota archaeon]